ncbi:magnesium transporter MgtE N-terminal domain-containing protein, partial [Vibrio genomosp. F10]
MENNTIQDVVSELLTDSGDASSQQAVIEQWEQDNSAVDVALLLESLPLTERLGTWEQLSDTMKVPVLVEMRADASTSILDNQDDGTLLALFTGIDADTLLELQDSIPDHLLENVLGLMNEEQQNRYSAAQQFDDEEVGHWCDHQPLVVPAKTKIKVVMRLLRRNLPPHSHVIYLVDSRGNWTGTVRINRLFDVEPTLRISELSEDDFPSLDAKEDIYSASNKVSLSGESSLPVITESGLLIGRLDMGTAYKLQSEKAESQLMAQAGLGEDEDLFASVRKSAQNR